jgi:hypothetical protein
MVPPGHVIFSSIKESIRFGVINVLGRFSFIRRYDMIITEPFEWGVYTPDDFKEVPTYASRHAPESFDLSAVASVLARSARERYMSYLHRQHPEYGWDSNAGHGTVQHIEAIKQYGVTSEHRGLDQVKSLKGSTFKVYRSNDGSRVSSN